MKTRPQGIAGMSKAICAGAALAFAAGWIVPAQALDDLMFLNNKSGKARDFCTYASDDTNLSVVVYQVRIGSNKCALLTCNDNCWIKRCNAPNDERSGAWEGMYASYRNALFSLLPEDEYDICDL